MTLDPWLPIGAPITEGIRAGRVIDTGEDWQILAVNGGGRALLARMPLAERWISSGVVGEGEMRPFRFGEVSFRMIDGGSQHTLSSLAKCHSPMDKVEALAFASAIRATRAADRTSSLEDGIYIEKLSRVLPVYGGSPGADDAYVLGSWLTGGLRVSVHPVSRIRGLLSWLSPEQLREIVEAAGLAVEGMVTEDAALNGEPDPLRRTGSASSGHGTGRFSLPGRAVLEDFFNDHVIDVVQNREHYQALGIGNPPAIILEGPPGCGKTVAVEKLIDFLGWPSFKVEAGTVASPYIHETSRKISQLFAEAIDAAPSVMVIDEMDAFLAARDAGAASQHRVEEVAEFLRQIPQAIKAGVLIIGMTNRIDMIDAAVLRRGRFDHVIKVDYANVEEMLALMQSLLDGVPIASDVDLSALAMRLAGRPLSDTAFAVREGARLAAKARKAEIDAVSLMAAIASIPASDRGPAPRNPIGFIQGSVS
ncbi:ATP-binding protein [Microvirga zambiensis]|uniref:ATP-binding protein n=1 Tax=Microvirga zambiensis TaxID=1402137 RepID=UPI00191D2F05|nr:ATP-binding protein [Microvirga zambiensis]